MSIITTTTTELPIIIVGAGIFGMALAQSLKKEGIPFEIYERDSHLHARAVRVGHLDRLGSSNPSAFGCDEFV